MQRLRRVPKKPRGNKPAPTFFVPPAREKSREKTIPSGVAGGTKTKGSPVFFERRHKLPELRMWSGWDDDMPPEYFVCPSCLVTPDENHLTGCPRPDMQAIGWHCPACDAPPNSQHAEWCPRNKFQANPYAAAAYVDSFFLERVGFEKQIIVGRGHPTPLFDSQGNQSRARLRIHLAAKHGDRITEAWRLPTLRREEKEFLRKVGDDIDALPADAETEPF
jgi:hypothetical protein